MYNPLFALVLTLAILGLIATPPFRVAAVPPTEVPRRRHVVDGLRGFAAFGVFLHHATVTHGFIAQGVWQLPPSRFFSMVGQVGVSVFFLITGYLFWAKLLSERGRPDWVALYIGRVFRIGPVYALAVAGMLAAVAVQGRGRPVEDWWELAGALARWFSLGLFSPVPITGIDANLDLAGVVWSLQYEWAFYAALPVLALVARRARRVLPSVAALAGCCVLWWRSGGPFWLGGFDPVFALLFVGGMACATLERDGLTLRAPPWLLSVAGLAATVAVFALFPLAYGLAPTVLLAAAFFAVLSGGDVFGLLTCGPARRLGDISFGVYMLQGLVLRATFASPTVRGVVLGSDLAFWAAVSAAAVVLIVLATAAHRWIELPGIRGGRAFIRSALARQGRRGDAGAADRAGARG